MFPAGLASAGNKMEKNCLDATNEFIIIKKHTIEGNRGIFFSQCNKSLFQLKI